MGEYMDCAIAVGCLYDESSPCLYLWEGQGKYGLFILRIGFINRTITEIAAKMMNGNIACPLVIGLLKLFSFTSTNCSVVIVLLSCFSISSFSRLTISFESIFHGFV